MRYFSIVLLLFFILSMLVKVNITLEKIYEERSLRVTEIHHHYKYEVESYGPITLNDKLVDGVIK